MSKSLSGMNGTWNRDDSAVSTIMGRLTVVQRQLALALLDQGLAVPDIATRVRCHRRTIERLRSKFQRTGQVEDFPRSGRPRITTRRQDSLIRRTHIRDRFATAASTARETLSLVVAECEGD